MRKESYSEWNPHKESKCTNILNKLRTRVTPIRIHEQELYALFVELDPKRTHFLFSHIQLRNALVNCLVNYSNHLLRQAGPARAE